MEADVAGSQFVTDADRDRFSRVHQELVVAVDQYHRAFRPVLEIPFPGVRFRVGRMFATPAAALTAMFIQSVVTGRVLRQLIHHYGVHEGTLALGDPARPQLAQARNDLERFYSTRNTGKVLTPFRALGGLLTLLSVTSFSAGDDLIERARDVEVSLNWSILPWAFVGMVFLIMLVYGVLAGHSGAKQLYEQTLEQRRRNLFDVLRVPGHYQPLVFPDVPFILKFIAAVILLIVVGVLQVVWYYQ